MLSGRIFFREDETCLVLLWLHCFLPVYPQKGRQDRLVIGNFFIIIYLSLQETCVCLQTSQTESFFPCLNHSISSAPFLLSESATHQHSHILLFLELKFPLNEKRD